MLRYGPNRTKYFQYLYSNLVHPVVRYCSIILIDVSKGGLWFWFVIIEYDKRRNLLLLFLFSLFWSSRTDKNTKSEKASKIRDCNGKWANTAISSSFDNRLHIVASVVHWWNQKRPCSWFHNFKEPSIPKQNHITCLSQDENDVFQRYQADFTRLARNGSDYARLPCSGCLCSRNGWEWPPNVLQSFVAKIEFYSSSRRIRASSHGSTWTVSMRNHLHVEFQKSRQDTLPLIPCRPSNVPEVEGWSFAGMLLTWMIWLWTVQSLNPNFDTPINIKSNETTRFLWCIRL